MELSSQELSKVDIFEMLHAVAFEEEDFRKEELYYDIRCSTHIPQEWEQAFIAAASWDVLDPEFHFVCADVLTTLGSNWPGMSELFQKLLLGPRQRGLPSALVRYYLRGARPIPAAVGKATLEVYGGSWKRFVNRGLRDLIHECEAAVQQ